MSDAQQYILCSNLGTVVSSGLNTVTLPPGTGVVLWEEYASLRVRVQEQAEKIERLERDLRGIKDLVGDTEFTLRQRVAALEHRERQLRNAIEQEPEYPGEMPDEMWDTMRVDKDFAAEAMRITVRLMKANLLRVLDGPIPYPDWCRHPEQCQGKSSCPEDPTCAD